jgi:hypothetical protein
MPRLTSRIKTRLFIAILFIISILIFSHYARHMHIEYVYSPNQTVPTRSFCAFKRNFHRLTWECVRSGLTYWFTVPLCIICNLIIIQRLHYASRIARTLKNNTTGLITNHSNKYDLSNKQRQLTAMLVTSSICFVLTATPSTIHTIYILITRKLNNSQYVIHIFTNILLHFHHASNFLAFIFSCARFRTELLHLFRRYFYCQIYMKWYKRPIPHAEQNLIYSTKQQKLPTNLLTSRTKKQNTHTKYDNRIVLLRMNKSKKTDEPSLERFI